MQFENLPPVAPPSTNPSPEHQSAEILPVTNGVPDGIVEKIPPKPRSPFWEAWPTVGFGAAIFGVYFVAQAIVTVIFGLIVIVHQMALNPNLDPFRLITDLTTNGLLISVATIVSGLAGMGMIVVFVKLRQGISLKDYLGFKPISFRTILVILLIIVALSLLVIGLEQIYTPEQGSDLILDAYQNSRWPVLFWIAVVIFAPVFEESFFRGFLFVGFRQSRLGPAGAILITSLVFALLHALQYDIWGIATVFILGLILGIVRYKTNSLWSSICLHSLWNLMQMVMLIVALKFPGLTA